MFVVITSDITEASSINTNSVEQLLEQIRQPDTTFGQFKRSLKTFMFG